MDTSKNSKKPLRNWRPGKPKKPKQAPPSEPLSRFERWAEHITQVLAAESKLVGDLVNHPTLLGDAREALVKGVLERMLPSAYEIGTGQVIDAHGNESNQMDIIIARRDFPVLRMPSGYAQYPVEGVIATIEVKSELDAESLRKALDNCRSIARLRPDVETDSLSDALTKYGGEFNLALCEDNVMRWNHAPGKWGPLPEPIQQRIDIVPLPETYIYGYSGYKSRVQDFKEAIVSWMKDELTKSKGIHLAHLPTLIVGESCVATRNQYMVGVDYKACTWPMMFVREKPDPNPMGSFILALLRKIKNSVALATNADGIRPSLEGYVKDPKQIKYEVVMSRTYKIKEGEDLSPPLQASSPSDDDDA